MKMQINRLMSFIQLIAVEKRNGEDLPCIEVNLSNGKYMLDGGKVNYSFGALHHLFRASFKKYRLQEKLIQDTLILGFGAGSVAHIISNEFKMNCRIKGVEKDPVVIELAKKYFKASELKNTSIECADAINFLSKDRHVYDLIVIDLFVENYVPLKFLTKEFITDVHKRLRTGGMVFFNKITETENQVTETNKLFQTMVDEFEGNIEQFKFSQNGVSNCMLVYQDK